MVALADIETTFVRLVFNSYILSLQWFQYKNSIGIAWNVIFIEHIGVAFVDELVSRGEVDRGLIYQPVSLLFCNFILDELFHFIDQIGADQLINLDQTIE